MGTSNSTMFRFSAAVSLLLVSNAGVHAFMAMPLNKVSPTSLSAVVDLSSSSVLVDATPDTPINKDGATLRSINVEASATTIIDPASLPLPQEKLSQVRLFNFKAGDTVKPHTHNGNTMNFVQSGKVTVTSKADGFSKTYEAGEIFFVEEGTKYGMDAD